MKKQLSGVSKVILAVLLCTVITLNSYAQTSERAFEEGSVWAVSYVETKAGQFNDYIADLSNVWRKFLDHQKEDGLVKSYKMLSIPYTRDDEPNLILMIEYTNWAAFDNGVEYFEELASEIMGSMDNAQEANINRGELRALRGSLVAQEIMFKE